MELSMVALAGIPAVSSLILDVAAAVRHRPAPPAPSQDRLDETPAPEPVSPDAEPVEFAMAARMWLRTDPRLS